MILLSLQGIQKSFGTNEVLRDASLVLQDGQRMGLVGVNGCGKSTLMKIIAGIETADGGTMTMQKGLKLGYLAQQGQVGEGRTGRAGGSGLPQGAAGTDGFAALRRRTDAPLPWADVAD